MDIIDINEIMSKVDHTLLSPTATIEQITEAVLDAVKYNCASVCIPPGFVKFAKDLNEKIKICTVVGFPNGYNTTNVKCLETADALKNGADEIDMVIPIGALKEGRYDYVKDEIIAVKNVCGDKILKVIIETCLLTDEEKIIMCKLVTQAGADFIKTSTGFSTGGATKDDILLFAKHVGKGVQIKAAGGISSFNDAAEFLSYGASRLGTSRLVKLMKSSEDAEGY